MSLERPSGRARPPTRGPRGHSGRAGQCLLAEAGLDPVLPNRVADRLRGRLAYQARAMQVPFSCRSTWSSLPALVNRRCSTMFRSCSVVYPGRL